MPGRKKEKGGKLHFQRTYAVCFGEEVNFSRFLTEYFPKSMWHWLLQWFVPSPNKNILCRARS